jgi:hypothetical protein
VSHQQLAADPVQRVALAAPVAEGLLLDSTTGLIETGVGQAHRVEVVDDQFGVREPVGQPAGVAGVGSKVTVPMAASHGAGRAASQSKPLARCGP